MEDQGVGVNDWVECDGKMRKSRGRGRMKEWRRAGIGLHFSTPQESINLKYVALPFDRRRPFLHRISLEIASDLVRDGSSACRGKCRASRVRSWSDPIESPMSQ
jgi:hypothetical protein